MSAKFEKVIDTSTTQESFVKITGNRCVIWIDPLTCNLHFGSRYLRTAGMRKSARQILPKKLGNYCRLKMYQKFERFVINDRNLGKGTPIDSVPKYVMINDFLENLETPELSIWFSKLLKDLESHGTARHKQILMRSRDDIISFLNFYKCNVVFNLKENGFLATHTGFEATAIITEDGNLGKISSGNHRFAIARAYNIPSFPLKIVGVHQKWFERLIKERGSPTVNLVLGAIQEFGQVCSMQDQSQHDA